MKINSIFLTTFLAAVLILVSLKPLPAQISNQSDITGPDPGEIGNQSDITNPDPGEIGNQSDITGPDPGEIGNQSDITNPDPGEIGNQSDITNPDPSELIVTPNNDITVNRDGFDRNFLDIQPDQAVVLFEELQAVEFSQHLGVSFFGEVASSQQISQSLDDLARQTGRKAAIIYVISLKDRLELLLILPNNQPIRKFVPEAKRELVQKVAQDFRAKVTNPRRNRSYLNDAQKLYQWIITPFESELQTNQIDTLAFSMDRGLRSIPIAALNDGNQFIIEKYSVALIPSFSLTDTRYVQINNSSILAMGISESTQGQAPLPAVAVEVPTLINKLWRGQAFLNEKSTLENLQDFSNQSRFGILHIATHAEFNPGRLGNSYIQFWNQKFSLDRLKNLSRTLKWNASPRVEMLVLSACKTALGNEQAELGFAGLAVQAGVKTALGSLWYVSDEGSLGLMTKFYEQLNTIPFKSEALRQAQLAMLRGEVRIENGRLRLAENNYIDLPRELAKLGNVNLSHPFFWSAFTMIGNWN